MFIVTLFIVCFFIAMLLPVPGKASPDVAELLARVMREVLKKL
jgi:hypothetical protein